MRVVTVHVGLNDLPSPQIASYSPFVFCSFPNSAGSHFAGAVSRSSQIARSQQSQAASIICPSRPSRIFRRVGGSSRRSQCNGNLCHLSSLTHVVLCNTFKTHPPFTTRLPGTTQHAFTLQQRAFTLQPLTYLSIVPPNLRQNVGAKVNY